MVLKSLSAMKNLRLGAEKLVARKVYFFKKVTLKSNTPKFVVNKFRHVAATQVK